MSSDPSVIYEFGPFRLVPAERLLLREGRPVTLTPKAFQMLLLLVERGGRLVSKDELMRVLWPDAVVEEAILSNNVYSIRKALGGGRGYVETVSKHGYRFVAEVRSTPAVVLERHTLTRTFTEEEVWAGEEPTGAEAAGAPSLLAAAASPRRALSLALALAVAAAFVVGAAAFGLYRLGGLSRPAESAPVPARFSRMSISRLSTSGKIEHAAVSPDGQYVTYVTRDAEGDSLWVRHVAAPTSVRIAGPAATEYVSVTFAPDGETVYYLTLGRDKGHTKLYRVPLLGGPSSVAADDVGPVGFSPDGSRIAFIRAYGDVSRLLAADADGAGERVLAERRQPEFFRVDWNAPAWSPDGKTIACQVRLSDERGQYETIVGVGAAGGSLTPLTAARWNYAGQPAWLPDGSGLLVTASENATDPTQVWRVALPGGGAARVTHDLNDYYDLSLGADGSRLAAVQNNDVSGIWVAPGADAGAAKQMASEVGWIQELAWTPDGRIVYRSKAGGSAEVWVMGADGSNPKQLTAGARLSRGLAVSPDGRHIFFASARAGHFNIWRVDADGTNLKRLTDGEGDLYPDCTPDGRWVVFQRGERDPRLWRVPADGGRAQQLTATRAFRPAVSPDGKLIAYHYLDPDVEGSRWRIGIVSSGGGPRLKQFDLPPTLTWRYVRWSPDGRAVAYANNPGGLSDIWLQPLDGGPPKQLTNFKAEQIVAFDWSRGGHSFAFVRAVETSDVVLIDNTAGVR